MSQRDSTITEPVSAYYRGSYAVRYSRYTLVVTELSRMTRSLLHLLETAKTLEQHEVHLVSLREHIDTTTATGRCFLSMMGAIHQMERELRAERAAAGRASAKARGKSGGRPRTAIAK